MYKSRIKINGYLEYNTFDTEQNMYLYLIKRGLGYIKDFINLYSYEIVRTFNDYCWFQDFSNNYFLCNPQLVDKYNNDLIDEFVINYPEEAIRMGNNITAQRIVDEYGNFDLVWNHVAFYHINFCTDHEYNNLLYDGFDKFIKESCDSGLFSKCIEHINNIVHTIRKANRFYTIYHKRSKILFECIKKNDRPKNTIKIKQVDKHKKARLAAIRRRNRRRVKR